MKQSDAKKLFIEYNNALFEKWGFKEKKSRTSEAIYIRLKENGYEVIGVSTTNYYPEVVFGMGTQKRINEIEKILWDINEIYSLGLNLTKDETWTLSFQGNHQNERKLELLKVEHKDDERGVETSSHILMNFIEHELLPVYDLFDDIREIDKRINGEGKNFWEDDFGTSKPFNLGGFFFIRRIIIGRLCKSEEGFNQLVEKIYAMIDRNCIKLNLPPFDRKDMSIETNITIKYLKENVSPIY